MLLNLDDGSLFLPLRFETQSQRQAYASIQNAKTVVKKIYVIIPFRNRLDLTKKCFDSVLNQKFAGALEIILIDHLSIDQDCLVWSQKISSLKGVRVIRKDYPYNYSRLNNDGFKSIESPDENDLVLFLNNDVELNTRDTLSRLSDTYQKIDGIGALGCTLLFPNGRIQHLFAAPGVKIVAAHPLKNAIFNPNLLWFNCARPVAAVTGACCMISVQNFKAAAMFDENLPTLGQDIDLCLKLQKLGKVNWVASSVVNIHYEGATKSKTLNKREVEYMYSKWGEFLVYNPFFSRRFSRWSEQPTLAFGEGVYPWKLRL